MKRSKQWEKLYKMGQNAAANMKPYNLKMGAAYFLGWCNVVGTCRADEFTGDEWYMSLDGQDIQETLQNAALNTRQFPYWTTFDNWEDITALMVKTGDGEYLELWGTSSSHPYLDSTTYYPLPVSLQGGERYHAYRLVRSAKRIIQEGNILSGDLSQILAMLPSPDDNASVADLMNDLHDKINNLRNETTRGRNSWTYYAG